MLTDEFSKVRGLVKRGVCRTYVLLTNARVTGSSEESIRERLLQEGAKDAFILDGQWICDTIAARRELRMFVPRVYGLGDLSQILDERCYAQASALLASSKDEIATFVATAAYRKAASALREHGFVMLLGDPGVGKSAIARMLTISAADNWSSLFVKARTSSELIERWNPNEPNQLFWVDDAFGVVRHEERLTFDWARDLPQVMSAIKGGAKVVLTSRSYIYSDARPMLKTYAYPLLAEQQITVDVSDISRADRHQILYNHLSFGDQPQEARTLMKPHLEAAADSDQFRPETARRLGLQAFTRGLSLDRAGVISYIDRPQRYLADVYSELDAAAQSALALIYATGTEGLPTCFRLTPSERNVIEVTGATPSACAVSAGILVGSFLRIESDRHGGRYHFKHPTLREGFATWLTERPHVIAAIIGGMKDESLIDSTDCLPAGAQPTQGTLLRIPPTLFDLTSKRFLAIFEEWPGGSCWTGSICRYMAHRASDSFLHAYLAIDPALEDKLLDFGSLASFVPEPAILSRLSQMGLLSEKARREACNQMARLARNYLDPAWLEDGPWQTLLKPDDRLKFMDFVRKNVVPNLSRAVVEDWGSAATWKSHEDSDGPDLEDPTGHALELYRRAFLRSGDAATAQAFADAIELKGGLAAVDGGSESNSPPERYAANDAEPAGRRSVFADIDELP
ncbi:nSTAND3 domain-containing NTPase [Micromonospora haikouensis]|uniref:nSTAND3 domain-containing NTPase n=1 Tax=Micromonospora haikouensis TaxID=686309 RepID=UPI0037884A23